MRIFLSNRKSRLSPVRQPQRLHGGVLDVHEGVDPVPDQGLDQGVLGGLEVVVGPELEKKKTPVIKTQNHANIR